MSRHSSAALLSPRLVLVTTLGSVALLCVLGAASFMLKAQINPSPQAVCGNRRIDPPEQCDDGNLIAGDGCSTTCSAERCGDGMKQGTEMCDDGNVQAGDGCSHVCKLERCGDNTIQPKLNEQCDDGNNANGDGCSATCLAESAKADLGPLAIVSVTSTGDINGGDMNYTLRIPNAGPGPALGVTVLLKIDPSLVLSRANTICSFVSPGVASCKFDRLETTGATFPLLASYTSIASRCQTLGSAMIGLPTLTSLTTTGSNDPNAANNVLQPLSGVVPRIFNCSAPTQANNITFQILPLPSSISRNNPIVFTSTFKNNNATPTSLVKSVFALIPGATLDTTQTDPRCIGTTQNGNAVIVNCSIPSIAASSSDKVQIAFNASALPCNSWAWAQGKLQTPVSAPGFVYTTLMCTAAGPSFSLRTEVQPTVAQGQTIEAKVNVRNLTTTDIPNAIVTFTFPVTANLIAQPELGCQAVGQGSIVCPASLIYAGKEKLFTFKVRQVQGLPPACNTVVPMKVQVSRGPTVPPTTVPPVTADMTTTIACSDSTLTVAVKSLGSTDVVVKNQKDVNLLRFEARAGDTDDVLLTKTVFTSQVGSPTVLNNMQDYTFWMDSDNDGKVDRILQKNVAAQGGKVTFDSMYDGSRTGPLIRKGTAMVFEVHAAVAASLSENSVQLKFSNTEEYLQAEDATRGSSLTGISTNGACAAAKCNIIVSTVDSILYKLVSQGDLYVTKSPTPVRNRQMLGGTIGDTIMFVTFSAMNERIAPTSLRFTATGNGVSAIKHLNLYRPGETQPFATAESAGCGTYQAQFCTNTAELFVIPKNSQTEIIVRPMVKDDINGALSGQDVTFSLLNADSVIAIGKDSSNALAVNNGDTVPNGEVIIGSAPAGPHQAITGNKNVVVLSKIVSITNANPNANGSLVPTGIADVGQFRFTATPHNNSKNGLNKVALSDMILKVTMNNVHVQSDSLKIYNKSDSTVTKSCTAFSLTGQPLPAGPITGSFLASCGGIADSGVNAEINQGTDQTFVLQMNITNPQVSGIQTSSLQVSLENFNQIGFTQLGPTQSSLRWIDKDAGTPGNGTTTVSTFVWVEYPETVVKSTLYQI